MTFDGIPADPLTPLIRRLNQSMSSLATLGAALALHQAGLEAPPALSDALESALDAMGAPPLAGLSAPEVGQALGLLRTFFAEAADLLEAPGREPGWTFRDPAILQGLGTSSAGMVDRMTRLGDDRAWFAALLAREGAVLDVGTGVGGVALAAAQAWPRKSVRGIDVWQPSLDLAERNRAVHPCARRVSFGNSGLQDVTETGAYDLVWLPTPFIAGPVVAASLPRLRASLVPGGCLVAGVLPPPPEPLGNALSRLRTLRNGGHPWSADEVAELLVANGFTAVEVPPGQSGMLFVLGRAAETGAA